MATTDESATRHELRSLAEQYARGVDRHDDVDGFVALFLPDATITIHDPSESTEPRELRGTERLARIPEVIQRYAKTFTCSASRPTRSASGSAPARCTASRTTSRPTSTVAPIT